MTTLTRRVRSGGDGLIRILALAAVVGWCGRLEATTEGDKFWQIWNELEGRQTLDREDGKTTETQKISSESRHCSNAGDECSKSQRHETHPDGSTEDYQWIFIRDEDGRTGTIETVSVRDPAGNRKFHSESSEIDPYGERTTETEDSEYDSHGNCTKHTKSAKHERVYQPYWIGSVTITKTLDDTSTTTSDSFGIGRNQLCQVTSRDTINESIKALLLPPKHPGKYHAYAGKLQDGFSFDYARASGANSSVTEAQIDSSVNNGRTKELVATQELKCDGEWKPWRHEFTHTETDRAGGSGPGGCGVDFNPCNGNYTISFAPPAMRGTHTEVETDSITPGKCWGSQSHARPPVSVPTSDRFDPVNLRGTVGVKRGDTLAGETVTKSGKATITTTWHLNLVTQAKAGAPIDEWE
jgi:hypothetical protein